MQNEQTIFLPHMFRILRWMYLRQHKSQKESMSLVSFLECYTVHITNIGWGAKKTIKRANKEIYEHIVRS